MPKLSLVAGREDYSLAAVRGLLIAVASPCCRAAALGCESSRVQGRFLTTGPPGKTIFHFFLSTGEIT